MHYLTGDTHGETARFLELKERYGLTEGDSVIVAGDFGCIPGLGTGSEDKLDALAQLPFEILFLDGNHECFPTLNAYPEETWHGGRVRRIRRNVLHLMRGQIFDLEGMKVFVMGGGYSMDRASRIPGRTWWPEELPSDDEYDEAWRNLHACGDRVDVIISHAAPDDTMELFRQTGVISHRAPEEWRLNAFLESVRQNVAHDRYYFGHMHVDRQLFRRQTALLYDVYCLETGEKVAPTI